MDRCEMSCLAREVVYVRVVVADVRKTWYDDHRCLMSSIQVRRNTLVLWDLCEELMLEIDQIDSKGGCTAQTSVSDSKIADFACCNPGRLACGKQYGVEW